MDFYSTCVFYAVLPLAALLKGEWASPALPQITFLVTCLHDTTVFNYVFPTASQIKDNATITRRKTAHLNIHLLDQKDSLLCLSGVSAANTINMLH